MSENSQQDLLGNFVLPTTNKNQSLRRTIGLTLSFIGCFMLATDISFSILSLHPITENYYVGFGPFSIGSTYSLLIEGTIILFIASFLLSKSDKVILNKTISITLDGIAFLLCLYLAEYFFIGKGSTSDDSYFSYMLHENILTNKVFAWSLFLLLYYLFGELSGGTFGKKIAQLTSRTHKKTHISLNQSSKKTLVYSTPIWLLLILFVISPHSLNDISESVIFKFCQWICFFLLFISLFMIFISKGNHSLADIFSNTIVEKKNSEITISSDFTNENAMDFAGDTPDDIHDLYNHILKEKKKAFSGRNGTIVDLVQKLFTDKSSFTSYNKIYNDRYSKNITEHLLSISSSHGTAYFYMEPFVKLEVCEDTFPYKILPDFAYEIITPIKKTEPANVIDPMQGLYNQIIKEKKKMFSGSNETITDLIEKVFTDKDSFYANSKVYKQRYSKDIIEHLLSISSSRGTSYFYMEHFIKLGVCENDDSFKIISSN